MEKNNIAFIVPAYNVANYIDACLESITSSLLPGDEIILINDGSTDGTEKKCQDWHTRFPTAINFISQPNQGLSAARNRGIRESKAPHILFVDSDDVIVTSTLDLARHTLLQYEPDIIVCDFHWWHPNRPIQHQCSPKLSHPPGLLQTDRDHFLLETLEDSIFSACSRIFSTKLIKSLGEDPFPIGDTYEEIATVPRLTLRAKSLFYLNASLLNYRVRANSITTTKTPKNCIDLAKSMGIFLQELEILSNNKKLKITSNKISMKLFLAATRDCGLTPKRDYATYRKISEISKNNLSIPIKTIISELKSSPKKSDKKDGTHLLFFSIAPTAFLISRKLIYSIKSKISAAKYLLRRI